MDLKTVIENRLEEIKSLRINLHNNAELAFAEYKTQEIIINYLNCLGLPHKSYANTGVVSVFNTDTECIAIRADMDALPIDGVFHGCGHDYHMAILLGVAAVLRDLGIEKCVKLIFQPAEEDMGGALPMINEGVLNSPKVKSMVGFHVWPGVSVGSIEVSTKASMASVDDFKITFSGRGGHAAMPHLCTNPLYPAMDFIKTIKSISDSNYNVLEPHVLTVTTLNCGSAPNVIADKALVMGTLRTFNETTRVFFKNKIIEAAKLSSSSFQCDNDIIYDELYPPLINDENLTKRFMDETSNIIGSQNTLPLEPTFAGEDFAFFAKVVPSVHFRLGISGDGFGGFPLHSPRFNSHEDALFYGIYIIVNFILSQE